LVSGKKTKEKAKLKKSGSKSFTKPKLKKSESKIFTFKNVFTNLSCSKKSVIKPINGFDSFDGSSDTDRYIPEINSLSTIVSSHEKPRIKEEEDKTESALEEPKIQWAQGKAGEDRVHVILSEENGWLFVGIYDGFSGPDPPDYLIKNLYTAVLRELKGLLWIDKGE
jgi:hypothetical protein